MIFARQNRIMLLGVLVLFLFGGSWIARGYRDARRAVASPSWPSVVGEIIRSDVTLLPANEDDVSRYVPRVIYRYTVNKISHTASRISFAMTTPYPSVTSSSRQWAQMIADQYPAGKKVVVHYDPADPGSAVLEPGGSEVTYGPIWVGAVCLLLALGLFLKRVLMIPSVPCVIGIVGATVFAVLVIVGTLPRPLSTSQIPPPPSDAQKTIDRERTYDSCTARAQGNWRTAWDAINTERARCRRLGNAREQGECLVAARLQEEEADRERKAAVEKCVKEYRQEPAEKPVSPTREEEGRLRQRISGELYQDCARRAVTLQGVALALNFGAGDCTREPASAASCEQTTREIAGKLNQDEKSLFQDLTACYKRWGTPGPNFKKSDNTGGGWSIRYEPPPQCRDRHQALLSAIRDEIKGIETRCKAQYADPGR